MQVFTVIGQTWYPVYHDTGDEDWCIDQIWIVGIYPDQIQADAIVEELTPLVKNLIGTNNDARKAFSTTANQEEYGAALQKKSVAEQALKNVDPNASDLDPNPDDGDTVAIAYYVLPGEFKQHF